MSCEPSKWGITIFANCIPSPDCNVAKLHTMLLSSNLGSRPLGFSQYD